MEVKPEDNVTFQPEITFWSFQVFLRMNLHIKILSIIKNWKSLHVFFYQKS